jgi:hypothetical protein
VNYPISLKYIMKINIILSVVVLLMCSCERNSFYSRESIETISKEVNTKRFSSYKSMYVYFPVDSNKIGNTPLFKMNFMYDESYHNSYKSLSSFLYDAFNQKIKIKNSGKHRIECIFILNKELFSMCRSKGMPFVLEKYFSKKGDSYCMTNINAKEYDCSYVETILYYLFLNNYRVWYGEISGYYYVRKNK